MRFLPVNLDALLVELDDLSQTLALRASLDARRPDGVRELTPGARTILVAFDPAQTDAQRVADDVARRTLDRTVQQTGARIHIPVHYNGEDLDEMADFLGTTRQGLIDLHTSIDYAAAFIGFAPGYAYLHGDDSRLNVPRRPSPRTRVPKGAVALAGQYSSVYPQESPGGWQLLGVTPLVMWDAQRDPPAILRPGDRVRFVDAATLTAEQIDAMCTVGRCVADDATSARTQTSPTSAASLQVQSSGLLTLFQDAGRPGQAALGVSASGAADQSALRAANRLVGNAPDAVCLEVAQGGLALRADADVVLAVTGADVPITVCNAAGARWQHPRDQPFALACGDVLSLGEARAGLRAYVAVRGGFAAPSVLGSCATDTLAKLGPPPVLRGDRLTVRAPAPRQAVGDPILAGDDAPLPRAEHCITLDVVMGPRTDWFTQDAIASFCQQEWRVTQHSNRVGLRLAGAPLARTQAAQTLELPSEGVGLGAIQVPPNGQPVLFLADHPLTGGYPVIAAVATYHLDLVAQIPAQARIRFRVVRAFSPILPPNTSL